MIEVVKVNEGNISLLKAFIDNMGTAAKTFRYFEKRSINVIKKHLVTLLMLKNSLLVAYGHLEAESDVVWLGICVLPDFSGYGYGKMMMSELINYAKEAGVKEIQLSVDKINTRAIDLYKLYGFEEFDSKDTYFRFKLKVD